MKMGVCRQKNLNYTQTITQINIQNICSNIILFNTIYTHGKASATTLNLQLNCERENPNLLSPVGLALVFALVTLIKITDNSQFKLAL